MKTKTKTMTIFSGIFAGALMIGAINVEKVERPVAQITFIVKDDFGKFLSNIEVEAWTFHHWIPSEGFGKDVAARFKTKTNDKGEAVIVAASINGGFKYQIDGNEYYYDAPYEGRGFQFKEKKNGRWEPWNPTIEIVYKPILKPIAMYQGGGRLKLPKREEKIGFDLNLNDFVMPYGKGEQTDLIFKLEERIPYESAEKPYDYRLKISFPNKGDGIQSWYGPNNKGILDMPRYAPTEGYESSLELKSGRDEKDYFKRRDDQNYFFQVRTQLGENRKSKSALYGKIVGNIDFWNDGTMEFRYYLNPTPLDVNMEHDPKKNLIPKKEK